MPAGGSENDREHREVHAANTRISATDLSTEWDSWIRATRLDSTRTAARAAAIVSAFFAPWLTFVTKPSQPTPTRARAVGPTILAERPHDDPIQGPSPPQ